MALSSQKNIKTSLSKEQVLRSLSKALKVDNSSNEESEEDFDEDKLDFISRKIYKMWKNKGGSRWSSSKRVLKEKKDKDKSSIMLKQRHFDVLMMPKDHVLLKFNSRGSCASQV